MGLALFQFHWLKLKIEVLGVPLALDSDASLKPSTSSCELLWLNFALITF